MGFGGGADAVEEGEGFDLVFGVCIRWFERVEGGGWRVGLR